MFLPFSASCTSVILSIVGKKLPSFPLYISILAVSLIACIIWCRLITFDLTQSVLCTAESSFGDSLNFFLLLWFLFARFFWSGVHFIPLLRYVRAEDPPGLVGGTARVTRTTKK